MSFGYSSGDGTGLDEFLFGRFTGSRFVNSSGSSVVVGSIDLLNITRAIPSDYFARMAIYSDYQGLPQVRLTYSDPRTSLVIGTNSFTVSNTVEIPNGMPIWVIYNGTDFFVDGSTADGGARWWNDVGDFPDSVYAIAPWTSPLDRILPAVVNGGGSAGASNTREAIIVSEPLSQGVPTVREAIAVAEPLSGAADYVDFMPRIREAVIVNEPLCEATDYLDGLPRVREAITIAETLHPVPLELPMSTETFPGFGNSTVDPSVPQALDPFNTPLPGLSWSVHKKPNFNTKMSEAVSGHEITNQMMQYPKWEFNLVYEFLEDRTGANSSLKTIVGFFCSRAGRFDSFLFKDPDDYIQVLGYCGDADGSITQYPFCRTMGGFVEKVGQVDTANDINVYNRILGVDTLIDPADYTIVMPNLIVFDTAPAEGTIHASFQYFFACRFLEDQQDYEKFMDKLWNLQECDFRSFPQ